MTTYRFTSLGDGRHDMACRSEFDGEGRIIAMMTFPVLKGPCPDCRGKGVVALFTSTKPCTRCDGLGRARPAADAFPDHRAVYTYHSAPAENDAGEKPEEKAE